MTQLHLVILNVLLYGILMLVLARKYGWTNMSSVLALFYFTSAILSYLYYIFPLYPITYTGMYAHFSLNGCVYTFIYYVLIITAFRSFNLKNIKEIKNCNVRIIKYIQVGFLLLMGVYVLIALPFSIKYFFSGDLASLRDETYEESTGGTGMGFRGLVLIWAYLGMTPFVVFIISVVNILLFKNNHKINYYCIALYGLAKLERVFGTISRATIIFTLIEILVVAIVFSTKLGYWRQKRNIIAVSLICVPFLYNIFANISTSRFSDDKLSSQLATLRYAGEPFLNFIGLMYPDMRKYTYGSSQFTMIKKHLGLDYDDEKNREGTTTYNTFLTKKTHYQHPAYIFYGLIGSYYKEWGFMLTIIMALAFNLWFRHLFKKKYIVGYMPLITFCVLAGYVAKGIFFPEYSGSSHNIMFIYLVVFFFVFRKFGHSIKIQKY